ncbi:MAG: putative beta-lysine N-acetyltransferase [Cyclobacteriaceae bacterium]|nr:putative beta-lysine N-acetyltransferase [Cyclobacteriaceae bacterium]
MVRVLENGRSTATCYFDEYSRRVRVDDYEGSLDEILTLVEAKMPSWAEKLIVKSRPDDVRFFESKGLRREAFIAGYYAGTDMHFMVRYLSTERSHSSREADEDAIVRAVLLVPPSTSPATSVQVKFAGPEDAEDLARLYREAFRIYPTPVYDPDHVRKTMEEGTLYVLIRESGKVISAASAEINAKYRNAELTDCATAEGHEGKGYMRALLMALEEELKRRGITCLYTIARSASFGMNKAFHQLGYAFGGRMTKNCMIYSGMEDMNVWYKSFDRTTSG